MTTQHGIMTSIDIKNEEILDLLNEMLALWREDEVFEDSMFFGDDKEDREEYVSDEYFQKIYDMNTEHNGYPEKMHGASLMGRLFRTRKADPNYTKRYVDGYTKINSELQMALSTRLNALGAVYPPGGYISWHTNANAPGYNLVLTWSEDGSGYWKHWDPIKKEMITVQDKPGWQAKAFYFGSYEDGLDNIVYHTASTDCWRMTVSYVFDREHKLFWEEALEELEIED